MGTQRQGRSDGAAPCAISARSAALIPRRSILMRSWRGSLAVAVRWICLVGAARFVGVVSRVYTASADDQMKSYRDGSWGNHTQARNAVFTGTRQTRPTKKATFPRDKAEKSPFQQHDLSILIVGLNQLKYRFSRTRKSKSHPSSNTQCPITPIFRATSPQPTTTPLPRAITAQSTRS